MNSIGGYFELADREEGQFPHINGVLLNTGRNALEYILRTIGTVRKVYLPYYTCEVELEPLTKLGIPYQFYRINEALEMVEPVSLGEDEYLIANNYFGLKDDYIKTLAAQYGGSLIVDCAQAFFAQPILGVKMFYSCRKFVGVADGGVAYVQGSVCPEQMLLSGEEPTSNHDSHLLIRKQKGAEAGFKDFQTNECKLDAQPIRSMSHQTLDILEHIDYEKVATKRRENFEMLDKALGETNQLKSPISNLVSPMVYPYWVPDGATLRAKLIENKVFCARYWPNVLDWCTEADLEYNLARNLVAIPCDQRYGVEDMQRIIDIINEQ